MVAGKAQPVLAALIAPATGNSIRANVLCFGLPGFIQRFFNVAAYAKAVLSTCHCRLLILCNSLPARAPHWQAKSGSLPRFGRNSALAPERRLPAGFLGSGGCGGPSCLCAFEADYKSALRAGVPGRWR